MNLGLGKLMLCFLIVFFAICVDAFSQKEKYTKAVLPLLVVDNQQLVPIIDSIISFSKETYRENLKHLTFVIDIKREKTNDYQVVITLVDYQGLGYILSLTGDDYKAQGYFVFSEHNFIVYGDCSPFGMFKETRKRKMFTAQIPELLWGCRYSTWIYTYIEGQSFRLVDFDPCINIDRFIPKEGDSTIFCTSYHTNQGC